MPSHPMEEIMSELSHREQRERPPKSIFGPLVLIALGVFFLFNQLNPLTDLHWLDLLRFWPLFLIFMGLNILALQTPRPYSTLLSGLLAVIALVTFGYILLYGAAESAFGRRFGALTADWQTAAVDFAAEGVDTAVYDLVIGPPGANLYALDDSRNLLEGTVIYQNNYVFDTAVHNHEATIRLAPDENGQSWVFGPDYWHDYSSANRWEIALNPRIPTTLSVVAVAGSSTIDLRELVLEDLSVEANAGEVELFLPDGRYDARLITNAAATKVSLPQNGSHMIELEANAGSVTLILPPEMEARIMTDTAIGAFHAANGRLEQVNGEENVWQTAGYRGAENRLELNVHIAVGEVTVK